ncbi:MAG: DUF3501 family protein [Pyrinomonadaceae bacterium]|nr:DUF3501 family protein [Pyrinomonadaceae bacterium]MCX7639875.1 DUF3501 family protein [Pyrinomonadaceae bacterium]MDW8304047.1 DUF3501 family protein [Acidobacteriota bacterium]
MSNATRKVQRNEILDYVTYEEQRPEIRASAMRAKERRRVHLGEHLTFLFENHETVRYQILEMIRAERIVKEADIQHEIETYNELLGNEGELGCTLLIEIEDPKERAQKLHEWFGLPEKVYVKLEDGTKIYAKVDQRQKDEHKISSVQFLKFACNGQVPVAVGCDFENYKMETELKEEQRKALEEDLKN